jgi:hypothetical protein
MERARAATRSTGGTPPAGGDVISQMDELKPELVAPLVVFLCTDKAANINGRDFIAGGNEISLMSLPEKARTIYREGGWTLDALDRVFAGTLGAGVKNPMPAQEAKA